MFWRKKKKKAQHLAFPAENTLAHDEELSICPSEGEVAYYVFDHAGPPILNVSLRLRVLQDEAAALLALIPTTRKYSLLRMQATDLKEYVDHISEEIVNPEQNTPQIAKDRASNNIPGRNTYRFLELLAKYRKICTLLSTFNSSIKNDCAVFLNNMTGHTQVVMLALYKVQNDLMFSLAELGESEAAQQLLFSTMELGKNIPASLAEKHKDASPPASFRQPAAN